MSPTHAVRHDAVHFMADAERTEIVNSSFRMPLGHFKRGQHFAVHKRVKACAEDKPEWNIKKLFGVFAGYEDSATGVVGKQKEAMLLHSAWNMNGLIRTQLR